MAWTRGVRLVLLLSCCTPLAAQEPIRRDSAGVEIVTNRAPSWRPGEEWVVSTRPVVTLGGPFDGEELWRVQGFVRAPDGTYAVLSAGHYEVRLFNERGRLVRKLGRAGDGPGEFAHPVSVALAPPDTILVMDRNAVEVFLVDGTVLDPLRAPRIPNAFGPGRSARPYLVASDRSMVAVVDLPTSEAEANTVGVFRPSQGMAAIPAPGAEPVYLGTYGGPLQERIDLGGGRTDIVMPPFARVTTAAIGHSDEARILIGDSERYEIRVFTRSGDLRRVIRRIMDPVRVEPRWVDEWIDIQRGSGWVVGQLPRLERAWSRMKVPASLPAFDAFTIDDLGYLWVTRPTGSADSPARWDVFSPSGTLLGTVEGPVGMLAYPAPQIGENYMMLLEAGPYGVEMVRVYTLDRRR